LLTAFLQLLLRFDEEMITIPEADVNIAILRFDGTLLEAFASAV
jgi:hypothetical protein